MCQKFPFTGKNKSQQEQGGTYKVRGETVEVTSTVNDDIGYTYIQNDSEVQQSRKPIRIRSCSFKRQHKEGKVYTDVVNKRTRYENVLDYKFGYKDIDYNNDIKIAKKRGYFGLSKLSIRNCDRQKKNTSTVYIQTVVKQGKPTLAELERLAVGIGENWKKLGRRLGVSDEKLEELDRRHDQMSEKA